MADVQDIFDLPPEQIELAPSTGPTISNLNDFSTSGPCGVANPLLPMHWNYVGSPGRITSTQLVESSGLAASTTNQGVLWSHNDSGDTTIRLFAMDTAGNQLAMYTLTGATVTDCEDIAIYDGYIYIGDIGAFQVVGGRRDVEVWRIAEPSVTVGQQFVTGSLAGAESFSFSLTYRGDHETLLMDPSTGDMYIISKNRGANQVYVSSSPYTSFSLLTSLDLNALTGGDFSPDGSLIVLRDYNRYYFYRRTGTVADALASTPYILEIPSGASEPQGEAVTFSHDNGHIYSVSEGARQPIHKYTRTI